MRTFNRTAFIAIFYFNVMGITVCHAQSGWFTINSGTNLQISDIQFLDQNTGYYVCSTYLNGNPSFVRKTTNGGNTWVSVTTFYSFLTRVQFINANTGTLVGTFGLIRRTTDGGISWVTQSNPAGSNNLTSVRFINSTTGVVTGVSTIVMFTTDAGSSWIMRAHGNGKVNWFDSYFFDQYTGVIVGDSPIQSRIIARTTDEGFNWSDIGVGGFYRRIIFVNNNTGFCAGLYVYKSTNSGLNWYSVFNVPINLRGLAAIDSNNIVTAGDSGRIYRTTNGGINWLQQGSGTGRFLNGVSFINSNTGWVCGDSGTLLKTTNGGITFINPITSEIPNKFSLSQNYPNPFNPSTVIKFQVAGYRFVKLILYDVLGREAETLVNEELKPGTYEVDFDGSNFASGVYYYRIEARQAGSLTGDFVQSKKMVLLK